MNGTITLQCAQCGVATTRTPQELDASQSCEKCYGPLVTVSAKLKSRRNRIDLRKVVGRLPR